jgi:hypothetical protein
MNGLTAQFADGSNTELAAALNDAMEADVMARWDYLLTWSDGSEIVAWVPIAMSTLGNSTAPSTTMRTVR